MQKSGPLKIGDILIYWLDGGDFRLDGGTMFGAVPKVLWDKRYPADNQNSIPMCNDPLLVKTPETTVLIDTGLGNKLDAKQKSIFQVREGANLSSQVEALGIKREEVSHIVLTHCDFDHAGGIISMNQQEESELSFPDAAHIIQKKEWEDVVKPHLRTQSTYLNENFSLLQNSSRLQLIEGDEEISRGLTLRYTGGHTRGHQLVEIRSEEQVAVHLGDLYPTHAHSNPLWVMAYDNFPLDVIDKKVELFAHYRAQNSWFTFYHDTFIRACTLGEGNKVDRMWPVESSS